MPELEVVEPVEVERGDGVDEEGGGDVTRLTCNEFHKLALFPITECGQRPRPEDFSCLMHQWLFQRVPKKG